MTKLNKLQKKDMREELSRQEALMDMDVLHFKDGDQRRKDGFQRTILAIQTIINKKLYKSVAPSLEIYFRDTWKISRAQVYRFIDCATVLNTLEGIKDLPSKERLCRSLKRHAKSPTNIRNLWTLVKLRASDREITSTLIGKCWEEIVSTGRQVIEDPIPKKKECKPRKPKINLNTNIVVPSNIKKSSPLSATIPSNAISAISAISSATTMTTTTTTNTTTTTSSTSSTTINNNNNIITTIPSIPPIPSNNPSKTLPNINTSFSSPSIVTVNNTTKVVPGIKEKANTTPLMTSSLYLKHRNSGSLSTPTSAHDPTFTDPLFGEPNQKMLLHSLPSLPTPTMTSNKTLFSGEGQIPTPTPSNTNGILNSTTLSSDLSSAAGHLTNTPTIGSNAPNTIQNKTIISSYPSPTTNNGISQPYNSTDSAISTTTSDNTTNVPSPSHYVSQIALQPHQKVNYSPLGFVMMNPSPSNTSMVDSSVMDSLSPTNQQILLSNDPNINNGNVIYPPNGYSSSGQEAILNSTYLLQQQQQQQQQQLACNSSSSSTPQDSYQLLTNPNIISPTLQSQGLSIQTSFDSLPSYPTNQPQTPQSLIGSSGIMDSNLFYQPNSPEGVVYPTLPNQLVYSVPPTPQQNLMFNPSSQNPLNYYNMGSEFQNGSNYE